MWIWLKKRFSEKSTWAGGVAILGAAQQITSMMPNQSDTAHLLGQVAEMTAQVGTGVVNGDYTGAGVAAVSGAMAMFMKEKGSH